MLFRIKVTRHVRLQMMAGEIEASHFDIHTNGKAFVWIKKKSTM
jgi:hypothetical protein